MLQTNIKTLKRDHCDCVLAFKMMWEWWSEIHKFQDWLFSELHCWPTPTRSVKATANPILSAKYYHQQKLESEEMFQNLMEAIYDANGLSKAG